MASRYQQVYRDTTLRCAEGCPVAVAACAVVTDSVTGGVLAQIKLKNLGDKALIACKVSVGCFEPSGARVQGLEEFQYLDLSVAPGEEFGAKTPIPLPNAATRRIEVRVTETVCADGTLWRESGGEEWRKIDPTPLEGEDEILAQFAQESGMPRSECRFVPQRIGDLSICSCGGMSKAGGCPKGHSSVEKQIALWADQQGLKQRAVYAAALEQMSFNTVEGYTVAVGLFKTVSGFKDSDEQAIFCREKIEEIKAKEEADRLERERQAEQKHIAAEKAAKKRKKIAAIVTPIVVVCIAFVIVLTTVIIPNGKYNDAISLIEKGDIINAYESLIALNGYKDSAEKAKEIFEQYKLKTASVGDIVYFGAYEQDNNTSNGKEDIEWLVLAKEENQALVISKYALDCQQYNTSLTSVTWETCSLRKWLNGTFLSAAFSSEEQNSIISSTVPADKNPSHSASPGNNTTDKVFLLSITEVNKYFNSDDARKCAPTDYAIAQGAWTSDSYKTGGRATGWWWLRSPGGNSSRAASVYFDGSVDDLGRSADSDNYGVRPALWINLGT